jgi:hypothetical protein
MHVIHTAGAPPNAGKTIFPTIGWMRKRRPAPTNNVATYRPFMHISSHREKSQGMAGGTIPCKRGRGGR